MTELTNICLSSGKSEAVQETPDEVMRLIDSLDAELPIGEFTGGEPVDDELPTAEFTGGELIDETDDDDDVAPEITTYDIRTGEPMQVKLGRMDAAPGTIFEFGELAETESGFPLLELKYKTWKDEEVSEYIGPYRAYDFSIGPRSNIGCGIASVQINMRAMGLPTPGHGDRLLNAMAKDAICNWCARHRLIPNPGSRLGWHDNVYKQFIQNCAVYIYGESHLL